MFCPTCKLEFEIETSPAKPFCSKRCKTIDLGRWLDGSFALESSPEIDPDEVPEDNWAGDRIIDAENMDAEATHAADENTLEKNADGSGND